jgi:hypothetical protein
MASVSRFGGMVGSSAVEGEATRRLGTRWGGDLVSLAGAASADGWGGSVEVMMLTMCAERR